MMGMIARVRVEFDNGCGFEGITLVKAIQALAVAVTEEVSLTAVPAKRAKRHWIDEARCRELER